MLGDDVAFGEVSLLFFSGVDGVTLIAEAKLTFIAEALWGKGLIGREAFSSGVRSVTELPLPFASFSSSVLSSLLRVPARGVSGFLASVMIDFGRYFGKAVVWDDRGRSDDERVMRLAFGGVFGSAASTVTPCSSTEVFNGFCAAEVRLVVRVTVLESVVLVLSRLVTGDPAPPMEDRPLGAIVVLRAIPAALVRREFEVEPASLAFFDLSAGTLVSDLFITSARAFPMDDRFKECLIEFRVVGLAGLRPPGPGVVSVGIVICELDLS